MDSLQEKINKTKKGSTLEIAFGEFHESLKIKKPITIKAVSHPIAIAGPSPTVSIESKDVVLDNMYIESTDDNGICLSVKSGCDPNFNNVFIKGKVIGLTEEEGEWEITDALQLAIIPNKTTKNKFIILSPVSGKIYSSELDDIICQPKEIKPGLNTIELRIKEIRAGNLISGDIIIETLKYKLKRKISVYGNTLKPDIDTTSFDGKLLWACKSNVFIKIELLKNLPKGEESKPYEFCLNVKELKCEGYDVEVDRLPEGLAFNSSVDILKISGIPKSFGKYDLKFKFKKDGEIYEYDSKLLINEKIVTPLKLEQIPDPIVTYANEEINIQCKIISSDSPDIALNLISSLPRGLSFNNTTGKLYGKISNQGKYKVEVKVSDGTSELIQNINLYVLPEEPLKVNLEKIYEFYENHEFVIPIVIDNAKKLSPKIKLRNPPDKIFFDDTAGYIKGKLDQIKDYKFGIEVEDTYKRTVTDTIYIKCIEKPCYTIKWVSDDTIKVEGERGNEFSQQIVTKIIEDPKIQLKYYCIGNLPRRFELSENGFLKGIIDGKTYWIKVKVEYKGFSSEKDFKVITTVRSSQIVSAGKPSKIFLQEEEKVRPDYSLKNELKSGRVNSPYKDILVDSKGDIEHINLQVSDLPDGLIFNQKQCAIEGKPSKEGYYTIKVVDLKKGISSEIMIKIGKSLFEPTTMNKQEKKIFTKSKKSVSLGKAFNGLIKPDKNENEK